MGSSPASGSVLTAQSLEPASDSVSPILPAPPQLVFVLVYLAFLRYEADRRYHDIYSPVSSYVKIKGSNK